MDNMLPNVVTLSNEVAKYEQVSKFPGGIATRFFRLGTQNSMYNIQKSCFDH